MRPPAFQFYADDFVAGVASMDQAEVGAYILLLCHQWSAGKIPDGLARLELIAKGKVSQHVLDKFPGKKNRRLEAERKKQNEFRRNRSESGRNGAKKRWHSHSTAIAQPMANGMAKHSSPSPSPSPCISAHTDSAVPAWEEVKVEAALRAVLETSARSFFDHHENNSLWLNQHGRLINWKAKLISWAANDRQVKGKTNANNTRIGEKRIDRSIGTANEGVSSQYEGLGRLVKAPNPQ